MRPGNKYLNTAHVTSSTHLDTRTGNAIIRLLVSAVQQKMMHDIIFAEIILTVEIFGDLYFDDFVPSAIKIR